MKGLKKQIKEANFEKIYLFYGEEEFLKRFYVDKLRKAIIPDESDTMNYQLLQTNIDEDDIINACETLPFMSDKRLIAVKNSGFFANAKNINSDRFNNYFSDFPDTSTIIFIEEKVDKRNKLYKQLKKMGYVVSFDSISEKDLIKWIMQCFKKEKKQIDYNTAAFLIHTVGSNMENITREVEKLSSYKLDEDIITKEDVENICIKAIEVKIFELLDALCMKNLAKALGLYESLLTTNEPPMRILFMITRQFRLIYKVKLMLKDNANTAAIGNQIGLRGFVVNNLIKQSKYFSLEVLKQALEDCLNADISIKTGKMDGKLALEMILVKYAKKKA